MSTATATPLKSGIAGTSKPPKAESWPTVELGDVVESMKNGIYRPVSAYADDGIACLRMYNIDDGRIVWRDIKRMRLSEQEIQDYELLPGDLLVNRVNSRELVGKTAVIPGGLERCIFESKNVRVRLRKDLADPNFVAFVFLLSGRTHFNQNAQQVVGMASVSQPQVASFQIPLPPLDEQRRIVEEIEKQFTRLDAGVAALRSAQTKLKRYRAAVLKAACEGKLVPTEAELARKEGRDYETGEELLQRILAERRKKWLGRGEYKEPHAPVALDSSLPEGWTWSTLDALAEVKGGITKDQEKKHTDPVRNVPYLRVANVQRGFIDFTEIKKIAAPEEKIRELGLKAGDILFNEGGDRDKLGRGWVWQGELPECIHQNHVFRARPYSSDLQPKFLSWYSNTAGQSFFFDEGKHTTNLASISLTKLKGLPVPVPPNIEQARIVVEIERHLSIIDGLDAVVAGTLKRALLIQQAVLQNSFITRVP